MKSRLFFFLLLVNGLFFSQTINLQKIYESGEQKINPYAKYIIHTTENRTFKISYPEIKNFQIPNNCESIDLVFTISGSATDSLYIYTKQKIPKLYLFKYVDGKVVKIGNTGFATKISHNSLKKENNCILFAKNEAGTYIAKISREKYNIGVPNLYIGNQIIEDKSSKKVSFISLLVVGFQFCIFTSIILFVLLNRQKKTPEILIFFLLLNITDTIYFLSKYAIITLESKYFNITNSQVWNVIGDLNIILYYIFFVYFFHIPKKSFVSYFVGFGTLFWIGQIFIEISNFQTNFWTYFAISYLNIAALVDMIVTITILIFVLLHRMNDIYYRIGAIGLFCISLSTIDIAFPHILGNTEWQGLSEHSYNLLQFCVLLNMMCFVSAILYKSIVSEKEKNQYKTKLLLNEIEKQKSLQSERNRISGDMHDELGAGISAIKLQSEILKQQISKNALNNDDVDEIIRISEEMKISMREMLWSLNSRNDDLKKFAEHCKSYIENYFSKSTIHYSFENNITNENISVSSDIRRAILLVIKEACHNIIKHSNATEIFLEFQYSEQNFCVTIKDNGNGFKLDSNTEGYGISTMKSRITSINGNIVFQSNEQGTKISISTFL